jgi:hypothetical protein
MVVRLKRVKGTVNLHSNDCPASKINFKLTLPHQDFFYPDGNREGRILLPAGGQMRMIRQEVLREAADF